VPGLHSRRYSDAGTMRTGAEGVFIPRAFPRPWRAFTFSHQLALHLSARARRFIGPLTSRATENEPQPGQCESWASMCRRVEATSTSSIRAMVLDTRSMGADWTAGRFLCRHHVGAGSAPRFARAARFGRSLRLAYEATAIRRLLYDTPLASVTKPALDAAAVNEAAACSSAQCRQHHHSRSCRRAAALQRQWGLEGALFAPIDEMRPLTARIPVRCVTCHSRPQ